MNSLLFQQFAGANIKDGHHDKHQGCGYENDVQHDSSPVKPLRSWVPTQSQPLVASEREQASQTSLRSEPASDLELNQDRHIDERFISAEIREPHAASPAATRCFCGR